MKFSAMILHLCTNSRESTHAHDIIVSQVCNIIHMVQLITYNIVYCTMLLDLIIEQQKAG